MSMFAACHGPAWPASASLATYAALLVPSHCVINELEWPARAEHTRERSACAHGLSWPFSATGRERMPHHALAVPIQRHQVS